MDKTERLFALLDALRRSRTPVTAETLAQEQAVSVRTIYRDLRTLMGLGAPITGEAGLGYVLRPGYFMPPLMFSPAELEALVLGARWVQTLPDADLGAAARAALAKIATASPDDLRARIQDTGLWPVNLGSGREVAVLPQARDAMRRERAVVIAYADAEGRVSERTIWPLQLAYYEGKEIIAAWCCLREDFRTFRVDRIQRFETTEQPYGRPRRSLSAEMLAMWERRRAEADAQARGDRGPTRRVDKAVAYVTRGDLLLVFDHADFPEAGMQVPAGSIEPGETASEAARRETFEETGLERLSPPIFLGVSEFDMRPFGRDELQIRSFFHLRAEGEVPEAWRHYEQGTPPIAFDLYWLPIAAAAERLVPGHGVFLSAVETDAGAPVDPARDG
jgi:predicted DNA-binding transcriptional regulator YafY